MAILIFIKNSSNTSMIFNDSINEDKLRSLTSIAQQKQMNCLPFIDYVGNTIFNQQQIIELKKEIQQLDREKLIDSDSYYF